MRPKSVYYVDLAVHMLATVLALSIVSCIAVVRCMISNRSPQEGQVPQIGSGWIVDWFLRNNKNGKCSIMGPKGMCSLHLLVDMMKTN